MSRFKMLITIVLGVALFGASSAKAQFTCNVYQPSSPAVGTWPNVNGSFVDCQESSVNSGLRESNDANIANYLNLPDQAALLKKYAVKFYVFTTPQDMFSEIVPNTSPTSVSQINSTTSGLTWPIGSTTIVGVPVSTVFELNVNGQAWPDSSYPPKAARHEIGHQMDVIWAEEKKYPPVNGNQATVDDSDKLYQTAVNIDLANFKKLYPTQYNTWETQAPYTYFSQSALEFFAEMFALTYGGGTETDPDNYMDSYFRCTYWYMVYYTQNNAPPANLKVNGGLQQSCVAQ